MLLSDRMIERIHVPRVAGNLCVATGLIVLTGWTLGIPWIKSVLPGAVEMKVNTAIGLLLSGIALQLLEPSAGGKRRQIGQGLSLLVAAIGLATVCEYAFGWQLGIDELLFRDTSWVFNAHRGRMSPYSAIVFTVIGLGLTALPHRAHHWLVWTAGSLTILIGGVSFIGYLWNASELVTDRILPPVAMNTAVAFVLLGIGTLSATSPSRVHAGVLLRSLSSVETKSLAGFLLTSALLVAAGGYTYRAAVHAAASARLVAHTQKVRGALGLVYSAIADAQFAHRNYLLSSIPSDLNEYRQQVGETSHQLKSLSVLIADNSVQIGNVNKLQNLIGQRIASLEQTAELFQDAGVSAVQQQIIGGEGRKFMVEIRDLVQQMDFVEERLLSARESEYSRDKLLTLLSLLTTLAAALVGFLMLFNSIRRELTTRAVAEEAVRQSEENLAVTLQSIGDAVLATDRERRITRLNPSAERLTGWTQAEAQGRPVEEVFRIVNEESRAPVEIPVDVVLATGEIHGLANHTLLIAKDGTEWPIADSAAPIRDRTGQILGVVLVFRDVSAERAAEKALRESEARYRTLFESIDEGFCVIEMIFDEQGQPIDYRFIEINPSFEKQTGMQNALGKTMLELAPHHESSWFKIYGQVATTGEAVRFQNRAEQLHRTFDVYAFRFGDAEKRQVAILFTDITQRQQAEEAVRNSEQNLAVTLQSIGDAVLATDCERRITRLNPAAERLTGWTHSQAVGRSIDEVFRIVHEQSREPVAIPVDLVLATGEIHGLASHTLLISRDGTEYPIADSAAPIRDQQGVLLGVVLVFRDVTEERQASIEIARNVRELADFKAALDQHAIVAITDTRGKITYVNDKFCAISRYSRDELIGQDHRIINSGYHPKAFIQKLWETIASGHVWKGELKNRAQDGTAYWVDTTIIPFLDASGKPAQYIAIRTDITERKNVEEQLVQARETAESANRAKSEFLAAMSHELRTPLNGILGMNELLLNTELTERQRQFVDACSTSGKALLQQINDILDLSKIEAGKMDLELRECNLEALVYDIADVFCHSAQRKGFPLHCYIDPAACVMVLGDGNRLRQILVNLIGNAMKFTSSGSVVIHVEQLRRRDRELTLRFSVSDTGIGIPLDRRDRLFAPFTQVDHATSRKFGGTGLGLSICKQFVELMGGRIGVDSEVGVGSTFWFEIPMELAPSHANETPHWGAVAGKRVLAVDGIDRERKHIRENLLAWKCPFEQVATLAEALDAVAQAEAEGTPFDVVLADCRLAVGDEYVQLQRFASRSRLPIIGLGTNMNDETVSYLHQL